MYSERIPIRLRWYPKPACSVTIVTNFLRISRLYHAVLFLLENLRTRSSTFTYFLCSAVYRCSSIINILIRSLTICLQMTEYGYTDHWKLKPTQFLLHYPPFHFNRYPSCMRVTYSNHMYMRSFRVVTRFFFCLYGNILKIHWCSHICSFHTSNDRLIIYIYIY